MNIYVLEEDFNGNISTVEDDVVNGTIKTVRRFSYEVEYSTPTKGRYVLISFLPINITLHEVEVYPTSKFKGTAKHRVV